MDEASGAEKAIELCEHLKQWDMYIGVCATEGLEGMRAKMRESLVQSMTTCPDPDGRKVLAEALEQWDRPEFLRYLYNKVMSICK